MVYPRVDTPSLSVRLNTPPELENVRDLFTVPGSYEMEVISDLLVGNIFVNIFDIFSFSSSPPLGRFFD
jgi:hypothetical protein